MCLAAEIFRFFIFCYLFFYFFIIPERFHFFQISRIDIDSDGEERDKIVEDVLERT